MTQAMRYVRTKRTYSKSSYANIWGLYPTDQVLPPGPIELPDMPDTLTPMVPIFKPITPSIPGAVGVTPGLPGTGTVTPEVPGAIGVQPEVPGAVGVTPDVPGSIGVRPEVPGTEGLKPGIPGTEGLQPEVPGQVGVQPEVPGQIGVRPEVPGTEGVLPGRPGGGLQPQVPGQIGVQPEVPTAPGQTVMTADKSVLEIPTLTGKGTIMVKLSKDGAPVTGALVNYTGLNPDIASVMLSNAGVTDANGEILATVTAKDNGSMDLAFMSPEVEVGKDVTVVCGTKQAKG
jgi:hypothetical protein